MSLQQLIEQYGYLALFIGTFLEGETILLIAGFAASRGYLDLWACVLTAFAGSLSGDQFAFFIGRYKGKSYLERRPALRAKFDRAFRLIENHQAKIALTFRFFYGLRNVTPFAFGGTEIGFTRFLILNAMGAAIWAVSFGLGGYYFGHALELIMEDVKRIEQALLVILAVAFLAFWIWRSFFRKKKPGELPEE